MLTRVTAAVSFSLIFLAFLLQGTGQATAPPRWPDHFPSLLPAGASPMQAEKTQNMGASSDEPVVMGPSEFFEPVGGLADLTLDDMLAGIDELLRTPPEGGTTSIPTEGTVDLTNNFRVDISGLPTTNVSKATWTKSGQLTVTVSMQDFEQWRDWYQSYVTRGDTGASLDGTLFFLGSDLTTETGSIDFSGLTPVSLDIKPQTANADQVAEFVITLEADEVRVKSPTTGAMVPVFPLSLIPNWLSPLITDAQRDGVSDSFIMGSLGEDLYKLDGGLPSDLPNALRAFEERLAVEALLFGGSVNLVETPFAMGGVSGGGAYAPLEAIVTSTGGSTGEVIDMYLVNNGKSSTQVDFEGLVLEPVEDLSDVQLERVRQVMAAASAGKDADVEDFATSAGGFAPGASSFLLMSGPATWTSALRALAPHPVAQTTPQLSVTKVTLDAYCLEFEARVPTEGVVFRIADQTTQASHAPMRSILRASRRLNEQGALQPDSDAVAYYHSIRQWAIWVDERSLDLSRYEETFVEHTKKNFETAGQTWSDDVEELVRSLVPNRWEDIERILDDATALRAARPGEAR